MTWLRSVMVSVVTPAGNLRGTEKNSQTAGGGGGIRTHETLSGLTVFKTAGVNRFPTPPL